MFFLLASTLHLAFFFLLTLYHRGSNGEVINCVTVPADLPFLSDISDIQS